jgi:predicted ribosome quality control (RQC) complex YloA/Tae2 family protein
MGIKTPRSRFFQPIVGQTIQNCETVRFDKLVLINMDNHMLHCFFYGKSPNIFLTDTQGKTIDQFKKGGDPPETKIEREYLDIFNLSHNRLHDIFSKDSSNKPIQEILQENLGGFNTQLIHELLFRTGLPGEMKAKAVSDNELNRILTTLNEFKEEINRDSTLIYFKDKHPVRLSLIELKQLSPTYSKEYYNDTNEAWKFFVRHRVIEQQRSTLGKQIDRTLTGRIAYLKNTLKKMINEENLYLKKQEAELKGNLLLTFMGQIEPAAKQTTLTNIFSHSNEHITIKLNPAKSVQQNAQKYFEKYKHLDIKRDQLRLKKDTINKELAYWEEIYKTFINNQSIPELSKLHKKLMAKGIIQTEGYNQRAGKDLSHAFMHYNLEHKWDIYVGKNAKNNEILTFKFAAKHDLWFHAQGVPGSHVIIKREKNAPMPPHAIIERTAAVAAHFSDAKHSSKVPVVYTEARYVRKPRKAAPGLVTLTNEKSIMVKPQKPF